MSNSIERILKTPLKFGGHGTVRVAADGYLVATVSEGMNDADEYAVLFAVAPKMLELLKLLHRADGAMLEPSLNGSTDAFYKQAREIVARVDAIAQPKKEA